MSIALYSFESGETKKIKDKGVEIKVNNNQDIEFIKNTDDFPKFNCLYNKDEIDEKITEINSGNGYFTLEKSDQLYLYQPTTKSEDNDYYGMHWEIDKDYNIPENLEFKFKDYLYGHEWILTWDGEDWIGNNCINIIGARLITTDKNSGSPNLVVKHSEKMAILLKESVYPEMPDDHSTVNFAKILYPYLKNWRVENIDGSIVKEGLTASWEDTLYSSSSFVLNDEKYDKINIPVKAPSDLKNTGKQVFVDLDINGNITELRWDLNLMFGSVQSGYLNTMGYNISSIELFKYKSEKRHDIEGTNKKNINIFIYKKLFMYESFNLNPFDIITKQMHYSVEPDPRGCSTLATDYNIHSSKVIWADNILTMRRDLNVVGGNVDSLSYEYALLKQIIDSILEQQRIQAVYNEYTDSIRNAMQIASNVLKILTGAVQLVSALSELSISSDNMKLNTYRTEDFHFPGGGGGYPGKDISGQFLLDMDTSAAGQVLRRFIPTETTTAAATSTLTATNLILNALNSLTQIGDATTTLMAGGLTLDRIPKIIESTRTIIQSTQTFTDSVHELRRRWREQNDSTVTDHTIENTDEMELDDLDEEPIPLTRLHHETVTNTAASTQPLFGNYTVESLSNLTLR